MYNNIDTLVTIAGNIINGNGGNLTINNSLNSTKTEFYLCGLYSHPDNIGCSYQTNTANNMIMGGGGSFIVTGDCNMNDGELRMCAETSSIQVISGGDFNERRF